MIRRVAERITYKGKEYVVVRAPKPSKCEGCAFLHGNTRECLEVNTAISCGPNIFKKINK